MTDRHEDRLTDRQAGRQFRQQGREARRQAHMWRDIGGVSIIILVGIIPPMDIIKGGFELPAVLGSPFGPGLEQ